MALDGITIAACAAELIAHIKDGRITKIAQPEKDELIISIKKEREVYRLLLSANASLPLVYLSGDNKQSPMQAPNFCMLLRKHIGSGKITNIIQPSLERILILEIDHLNELGDPARKKLIIELMGKHSNIIFATDEDVIIDSIKHVSAHMSSVREVLPGRPYFIPKADDKLNPLTLDEDDFMNLVMSKPTEGVKALYQTITGISPVIAEDIFYRAGMDAGRPTASYTENERRHLYRMFSLTMDDVKEKAFTPNIVSKDGRVIEFAAIRLYRYENGYDIRTFKSISEVLREYYAKRDLSNRMHTKSFDLRRIVHGTLERDVKKLSIWEKQMKDTAKKDKFRIYGELLNTYGYQSKEGDVKLTALNYYTNEEICIPLDPLKSAGDNAKRYFEKYNKMKRTETALVTQIDDVRQEIDHLESILNAIDIATSEADLQMIKEEMTDAGYIHKRTYTKGKKPKPTKPLHFISSDGLDIYVGKNNIQNEELTFKVATGNDWWFHAKGRPGSHVIVKCAADGEMPDRTFEEAGKLAGYYSSGKDQPKVEIDYTQKKNIKKPAGSKPGFVIYHTNYSLTAKSDITGIAQE